jgi:dipeptidase D
MTIGELEPKALWRHFNEICKIPHGSGNETELRKYMLGFAMERELEAQADKAGNVVVRVPATPGHETAPVLVLQGHLDMVCEKNSDISFDFAKDAIQPVIDGDWVTAKGTTLGADNGIGLAATLAVVEAGDLQHGPLELLFTVEEEVGLVGAGKIEPGFVNGRMMLNLDSEELDALYIGCAGGGDSTLRLPMVFVENPGDLRGFRLQVAGLRGGHSGIDIHEQRGNAIKILSRILWKVSRESLVFIERISGGSKRNAIAREADAFGLMPLEQRDNIERLIEVETADIKAELGSREPELSVDFKTVEKAPAQIVDEISQQTLLDLLLALPHGVATMSYDIPGLVETSNNLATIATKGTEIVIGISSRSSALHSLQALRNRIRAAGELAGASVEENEMYPGWKPDLNSNLLTAVKRMHQEVFGKEPELKAIHAGLECGIIGQKFPGMDMISFGPEIRHPHSPGERVNISSVGQFWKLLRTVVEGLA